MFGNAGVIYEISEPVIINISIKIGLIKYSEIDEA